MLCKARNGSIKVFNDYNSKVSEAKKEQRMKQVVKELKILTPEQLLQRLPIALAQVKAVYNNIIKSIQL